MYAQLFLTLVCRLLLPTVQTTNDPQNLLKLRIPDIVLLLAVTWGSIRLRED